MSPTAAAILLAAGLSAAGSWAAPASSALAPTALWAAWPAVRFVSNPAPCLRHSDLVERLRALEAKHRGALVLEEAGRSAEGRSIHLVTLGRGPRRVLLWSQMHGDEPSATPALLDLADFLLSRRDDEAVRGVLDSLTLLMLPMLNPDGAEGYERRNGQGIDVNRDALNLATPEGRLLKAVRDRYEPELGFNLHDQNRRTTVGESGVLATIALLAVAGDPSGAVTPGRLRARRVCSALAETLRLFVPGGISRYDEDWSPRAFGDNITAWGTPVVLIESGGAPEGGGPESLTRLSFVGLASALGELARDDLASREVAVYDGLVRNASDRFADVVLRGGRVLRPGLDAPFRADVAFDVLEPDTERAGCPRGVRRRGSRLVEVGDARFLAARRSVEVGGGLIAPGFVASVRGLEARRWLSPDALAALARLGVARLRWHVVEAERAEAGKAAESLSGPERPAIDVTSAEAEPAWLEVERPPAPPRSRLLADVLDALAGAGWRAGMEGLSGEQALGRLAGAGPGPRRAWPAVDAPASLVVLDLEGGAVQLETASLRLVFLDGAEVPQAR